MHIRHHTSDIPSRVGFAVLGVFDGFEVANDRRVEEEGVAFVEGINLASRRDLDLGVGKDELSERLGVSSNPGCAWYEGLLRQA